MAVNQITLKCPKGHERRVGVEFAGKSVVCDECGHVWRVPALARAQKPRPDDDIKLVEDPPLHPPSSGPARRRRTPSPSSGEGRRRPGYDSGDSRSGHGGGGLSPGLKALAIVVLVVGGLALAFMVMSGQEAERARREAGEARAAADRRVLEAERAAAAETEARRRADDAAVERRAREARDAEARRRAEAKPAPAPSAGAPPRAASEEDEWERRAQELEARSKSKTAGGIGTARLATFAGSAWVTLWHRSDREADPNQSGLKSRNVRSGVDVVLLARSGKPDDPEEMFRVRIPSGEEGWVERSKLEEIATTGR